MHNRRQHLAGLASMGGVIMATGCSSSGGGEAEKEVFSKDFSRVDPPGTYRCESVAT